MQKLLSYFFAFIHDFLKKRIEYDMKIYFLSSQPCALIIGGAYFGRTGDFERFAEISLQDNLPNTIMEAMACGIPCVGFNVGGIPEMIDHLHNGYVADYKSAEDFANGIHWALSEGEYQSLSEEARRKVLTSYSENAVTKKYIEVYNKITGTHD